MRYSRVVFFVLPFAALVLSAQEPVPWKSPAEYHQLLKKAIPGTLVIDRDGVGFQSAKFSRRWLYDEIQTFDLTENRELVITGYENRHWHEPGERTFRFTMSQSVTPDAAARLAAGVQRPVINGVPAPTSGMFAEIPAHERARVGGSNGKLRFRADRIDYLATDGRSSRTWRWSDVQTIASGNRWEFRVTGYREIVQFDLKQPMPQELFDRLWNILYFSELNLAPGKGGHE